MENSLAEKPSKSLEMLENLPFKEKGSFEKTKRVAHLDFPPRKVWMKTYGCQMNYHDTQRILSYLSELNFSSTDTVDEADLILFNTCAVRDLANQKFYSHLGEMKHLKEKKGEKLIIGMGGCIAQTEGKDLIKKYDHLDFAFGTDVIDQINELVFRAYAGDDKFSINAWDRSDNYSIETKIVHGTPQAFINIIKGCNKYCTYCIVPYTRGKERSRRIDEIVRDVARLVEQQGIQEIMLLGQNVNSFGKENGENLSELIRELEPINGLHLIRYTTSHPYDMSDELIKIHGESKKLSNHLHLPVQSGSASVLQRMNRQYTPEHYLGLLRKLRASNPNIVLSTDIIVGFPNETEAEYQMTLDLLEQAQFDFIYSYAYSPRKYTRSARMEDFLTNEVRGERLRYLQKFQLGIQEKIRAKMVGKSYRLLVDGQSHMKGIKKWKGRTNCNRIVHFLPPQELSETSLLWNWVDVEITEATALSCQGKFLQNLGKNP